MFVYLSKILTALAAPGALLALLLLFGALIRKPKVKNAVLWLAFAFLMILGNKLPGAYLTRQLEQTYPPYDGTQTADAIVVLGGGTVSKSYPRQIVEVNGAGDRVIYASKLWHDGAAPLLLCSGSYISWRDGETVVDGSVTSPASENAELARMLGVDADAIITQDRSVNTAEEARDNAALLKERGIKRVILVTSAMHMRRAVALFEKQGLEVIPAPTDYSYSDEQWENEITFSWAKAYEFIVPSIGNIRSLENALKEYLGYFVYGLRGWL